MFEQFHILSSDIFVCIEWRQQSFTRGIQTKPTAATTTRHNQTDVPAGTSATHHLPRRDLWPYVRVLAAEWTYSAFVSWHHPILVCPQQSRHCGTDIRLVTPPYHNRWIIYSLVLVICCDRNWWRVAQYCSLLYLPTLTVISLWICSPEHQTQIDINRHYNSPPLTIPLGSQPANPNAATMLIVIHTNPKHLSHLNY